MENKDTSDKSVVVRSLNLYHLTISLIILFVGCMSSQLTLAENPYTEDIYIEDRALSLAKETFSVLESPSSPYEISAAQELHYDLIDVVLQDRRDAVQLKLLQSESLSNQHIEYFQAYADLLDLSAQSAKVTDNYNFIKSGLKKQNWETRHFSALLLAMVHLKASDAVEALHYAEKALLEIPTDKDEAHSAERYYAHWALYMSFVIDGDLSRTFSNIERMLTYSKLSGRRPNEFDLVNNMAVMLDKSGNLETAIKLSSILTMRAEAGDAQDKFIANFSHGRFLLKADQYADALLYLTQALDITTQDFYKAYIHVDLATAYAQLHQYDKASQSIYYLRRHGNVLGNAVKYADRHINQPKALIAASKGNYEEAFNLIRSYSDQQIRFYKEGLSADRRDANRRVLLSQEIAEKNLEKAELQSQLARETLAKQKAKGRLYLALIAIGFVLTVSGGVLVRHLTKLNRKLKDANDEIIEKSKVKTDLLAMFSHEMLTPLNGIVPLADVLQRGETDEKKKKLLKMIEMSGTELTHKMKDIILVANPYGQSTSVVSVHAKTFLYECLTQFHDHTPDGVNLTVQIGRDFPDYVEFDAERVKAAITALLSNSLKFTDQGQVVLSLYKNKSGRAVIDVMDTGGGIDPERLDDMSKPFGQESLSITRENQGLGLGLTIVRLQCLIMGADFQMESELGLGTTVRMTLPENPAEMVGQNPFLDAA